MRLRTSNKIDKIERISVKLDVFIGSRLSFLLAFYYIFSNFIFVVNEVEADKKIIRNLFRKSDLTDKMRAKVDEFNKYKNEVYITEDNNQIVDVGKSIMAYN